jgi:hypothetical protein
MTAWCILLAKSAVRRPARDTHITEPRNKGSGRFLSVAFWRAVLPPVATPPGPSAEAGAEGHPGEAGRRPRRADKKIAPAVAGAIDQPSEAISDCNGEICALRWVDVDLSDRSLRVEHAASAEKALKQIVMGV